MGLSTDGKPPSSSPTTRSRKPRSSSRWAAEKTCPVFPGNTYEDWTLDDPKGQDIATVRRIVGDVDTRVRDLLERVGSGSLQQ